MNLKRRIQDDLKAASVSRDFNRISTIRRLMGEIKEAEIRGRKEFSDLEISKFLQMVMNSRKEAARQFIQVKRADLAREEENTIKVIDRYLKPEMTENEIAQVVQKEIRKLRSGDKIQISEVIEALRSELAGRANMDLFAKVLKNLMKA